MKLEFEALGWRAGTFELSLHLVLEGEVVGIFGPSGSGKTTLLELVAGLRKPRNGRILLEGEVLFSSQPAQSIPTEKRGIGYVPQDLALFPHLSARQNLLYGAPPNHHQLPPAHPFSLASVSSLLELSSHLDRPVQSLSGGEQQRVALGRALLAHPRLLLLDEPLASLDLRLKDAILETLQRIRRELHLPMLYVSHEPNEVVSLCDSVLCLRQGRRVAWGSPAAVFKPDPRKHYVPNWDTEADPRS